MSGIKKGVALRKIVKVIYEASKDKRFSRPMLGNFGMINCEKSVRYKSELINPSVKSHNKETMKNNHGDDDDDDDDNEPSFGLKGMIVANNTVFVGPHTVHPERQYT